MGNYDDFEIDFVSRTIQLIEQYNELIREKPFEEQFNYTLTLNCLLGLIVMPKERVITYIPASRLTTELKIEMGLAESILPGPQTTLRQLINRMRHSVAHFDIEIISHDERRLVDFIAFKDTENRETYAQFKSNEVFSFLRFYANALITNLQHPRRLNA